MRFLDAKLAGLSVLGGAATGVSFLVSSSSNALLAWARLSFVISAFACERASMSVDSTTDDIFLCTGCGVVVALLLHPVEQRKFLFSCEAFA